MTATTAGPTVGSDLPARLAVGCRFEFSTAVDTHAVVIVEPHATERRRVVSERFLDPSDTPSTTYHDVFGNTCRRLTLPAGHAAFSYAATIINDAGFDDIDRHAPERLPSELPDDALVFLLPSRYCPSDLLAEQAYDTFGEIEPGWNRVDTVAGWTHDHVTFDHTASSPAKTAADVLADGRGVCRDFTHLTISLCRALNIPARYVVDEVSIGSWNCSLTTRRRSVGWGSTMTTVWVSTAVENSKRQPTARRAGRSEPTLGPTVVAVMVPQSGRL